MDPVNDLVFVDNDSKFISVGDDKKIILWEFGVNLVIKNIMYEELASVVSCSVRP